MYDYFNIPQGYQKMVDIFRQGLRLRSDMLNARPFYTIRCKRCGRAYPIVWHNSFPYPDATSLNLMCFVNAFKELSDKSKRLKKEKFEEGEAKREKLHMDALACQEERLRKKRELLQLSLFLFITSIKTSE